MWVDIVYAKMFYPYFMLFLLDKYFKSKKFDL